jgi:hypothetical protein
LHISSNGILRPEVIAFSKLWIGHLRVYQTIFRNGVAIKVDFGLVVKIKLRDMDKPRWDFPLLLGEIFSGASLVI